MSGQLDFGTNFNNAGAARIDSARAFSEGIYHRAGGTAAARPLTDNPHEVGSENHDAWDRGWAVANSASPSAIAQSAAPGVAIPTNAVPA
jgi:hypothetical protein